MKFYIIFTTLLNLLDENLFTAHTGVVTTKQIGKLSEPCETEAASVRNPIGSEIIYILNIVDKFIHVHSVVASLNNNCKKYSMSFIISKQGLERIFY